MNLDQLKTFFADEWREMVRTATAPQREPLTLDEGALITRAAEGAQVRQFLESAPVQAFMAHAEANLTQALLNLPLDDDKGRRNFAVAIQAQRQLRNYLLSLAADGRSAERELERLRSGRRDFF